MFQVGITAGKFRRIAAGQQVWICKTDINSSADLNKIASVLNSHPEILEWTVDTEDNDRVLRVVTTVMSLQHLVSLVSGAGFQCEELPD